MTPAIFAERRRRFMERLPSGAAALFVAAPQSIRSHDVEYRYRQSSDFYYLTGFPEPEAAALFLPGHPKEEFVLFVRPRDPEKETWTGYRAGVEGAMTRFSANMAYTIDKLDEQVQQYLADRDTLYVSDGRDPAFGPRLLEWRRRWQQARPRTGGGPAGFQEAGEILHELRLFKSPEELALMRQAAAVTARAHAAAMAERRPGVREFEIEALLDYTFRRGGAAGPAYPSIVASGANATILHYVENDREMQDGELLLIDAGAEYDYYCADVTRTYPVGRRFTEPQRAVYDLVLAAQEAAIAAVAPGVTIEDVHARALRIIVEGVRSMGLLGETADEIIEKELYKPFYMHRTSHWLGMDVHDVGAYKVAGASRKLEPGMVLTVEPGLYVAAHQADVAPQWLGVGVRIEDDVLVTATGHEVLTADIPKLPADVG
jgi:Xaa-Pro aminopeptidase